MTVDLGFYAAGIATVAATWWAWRTLFRGWQHTRDRRTAWGRSWRHRVDGCHARAADHLRDWADILDPPPAHLPPRRRHTPRRQHKPPPYKATPHLTIAFEERHHG